MKITLWSVVNTKVSALGRLRTTALKQAKEFKSSEKENGAELGKDWVFEDLSNSKQN